MPKHSPINFGGLRKSILAEIIEEEKLALCPLCGNSLQSPDCGDHVANLDKGRKVCWQCEIVWKIEMVGRAVLLEGFVSNCYCRQVLFKDYI